MNLKQKAEKLNLWIEDVRNWTIILEGKEYLPTGPDGSQFYGFTHENLKVAARVEMYGFGKIYKKVILTSDKYQMEEIPVTMWHEVWSQIYNPNGQDAASPWLPQVDGNMVVTSAKWWPPDSYVKELVEKRNFMDTEEFKVWSDVIDQAHQDVGGKTPNYIKPKPFVVVH
uniref:Uncharacterized protein n=1 Tax=viral metagenome TaxID=1070528 RepID=A0A6M3K750_9ZZZZ